MKKTNAARQLDRLGLSYEIREYDVDVDDLSAPAVALEVGLDPSQVWKTLVLAGDEIGHPMATIAADAELDLKAVARASGNHKVGLVPLKDVFPLTGYVRGGVTALAARKRFAVFADASMSDHARIAVSAGVRGRQIVLDPNDYIRAVGAKLAPIRRR